VSGFGCDVKDKAFLAGAEIPEHHNPPAARRLDLAIAALVDRIKRMEEKKVPPSLRGSASGWFEEVDGTSKWEQDRAPAVLSHHPELARPAAHRSACRG